MNSDDRTFREGAEHSGLQCGARNDVSGVVVGPSVQAGTIHGGVHFHRDGVDHPVPRQLAAPPALFTNRDAEVASLLAMLDRRERVLVVLSGLGGVGKTALALRFASLIGGRFTDGQLYYDLGGWGGDPVDPGEVLASFLRALGVAPDRVPVGLAEQTALYRSVTATRSLLVVLDNALSAAQARVLIPVSTSCVTVVTSRRRLVGLVPEGARLLEIEPLSVPDGVHLLARTLGDSRVAAEPTHARRMAELCGGLPAALCVVAARLVARPRLPVRAVAGELLDERRRLEALSLHDGEASVEASLDLSYQTLSPAGAALYRRLALHPGREFSGAVVANLNAHADSGPGGASLDLLLGASLLEEVAVDRFRFHDLLRLHARRRAVIDDPSERRSAAVLVMLEWYLAAAMRADQVVTPYRRRLPYQFGTSPSRLPNLADRGAALEWLEQERVNLIDSGRAAMREGRYELAWHLADVMWPLLLYRKHRRDRLEIDQRGVAAAKAWGNQWAEAHMYKRLSRICFTTGDPAVAEDHLLRSLRLYQQVGDERDNVDAQAALAALHRDMGKLAEATATSRAVLAVNRRLADPRSTGLALLTLAGLLADQHQVAEAVSLLAEAEQVFSGLSDIDPYNGVRVQTALAAALLAKGDPGRARSAAERAAEGMARLGSDFERAHALDLLGQAAAGQNDVPAALAAWTGAHQLFETAGTPSRAAEIRRRIAGLASHGVDVPRADDAIRPPSDGLRGDHGAE